jgi:hypothetical protein
MVNRYIVARDPENETPGIAREYRGVNEWVYSSMRAMRYSKQDAIEEVKKLSAEGYSTFFYKA